MQVEKPEEERVSEEAPEPEPLEQVRQYVRNVAELLLRANKLAIHVPKENEAHVALVLNKALSNKHYDYVDDTSLIYSTYIFVI